MAVVWQWLQAQGASHDLVEWVTPFGEDFAGLWLACPRGDWLLALVSRLGCERSLRVQAALQCARVALVHVPEAEMRPAHALDALEAWLVSGDAAGCDAAQAALQAAISEASDPAAEAAAMAALAAFDAREQPEAAISAAALACQAAVLDAGDCAMFESLRFTQRQTARCVRDAITAHVALGLWTVHGPG